MAKKKAKKKAEAPAADYSKLRQTAYELVVEQGKTQKQAACILSVSEKSMSEWAIEGNWREQRKMRQSSTSTARENIQCIISLLSDKRLKLEYQINEARDAGDKDLELRLRKEANQASNEMSYNNKALVELNKEKGATLGQYVDIFDDIFSAMRAFDPDLFERTIIFQGVHLRKKSNELG